MLISLKKLLEQEELCLAPYAMHSKDSQGRAHKEISKDERLPFQKDRDRIIHCKSFRRLEKKTQVFTANFGDHYRTRLTHSIEVAQISRDICRSLGLNEDLGETIALAHDLGHPPFAHSGQDVLNEIMQDYDLHFEHNEQSRRIVEKLEHLYPEFVGLNLTLEVLDGLLKHQSPWDQPSMKFERWAHLEAQVVNLADEIAYTNHDIDDGIRSGIISHEQLAEIDLWKRVLEKTKEKHGDIKGEAFHYRTVSTLLSMMIEDVCLQTEKNIIEHDIKSVEDVRNMKNVAVAFSFKFYEELSEMRNFLHKNFYLSPPVLEQFEKAKVMMQTIFDHYRANTDEMPHKFRDALEAGEQKEIVVKDYLAGMTDGYMLNEYEKLVII